MSLFPDLTQHPERLSPQSRPWCNQLAERTGKYEFPWKAEVEGLSAESVLTAMLTAAIDGGRVLDVGCGHGEYTKRWASQAEEVVGFDMTESFIRTANLERPSNVQFVIGDTHRGLPFPDDAFDLAYTKKGPSSWYAEGNRVVRPGGALLMLHPGDASGGGGKLGEAFPGLFGPPGPAIGTPILDKLEERIAGSGLADVRLTTLKEVVWFPTPDQLTTFWRSSRSGRATRSRRTRGRRATAGSSRNSRSTRDRGAFGRPGVITWYKRRPRQSRLCEHTLEGRER